MLRQMRSGFKNLKWALWAVIIAFIGGFIVTDAFTGKSRDQSGLLYLNGEPVVQAGEYQKLLQRTLYNYKQQFKDKFNKSMIRQWGIPEQMLQSFVEKIIIEREAGKLDITASDRELKEKIMDMPYFQRDGKFVGWQVYKRAVAQTRMKITEFEQGMKEDIIREKFEAVVTGALVIDPNSLREKFKKDKDEVELDYVLLRPSQVKKTFDVSDAEMEAYYNAHKEDFKSMERRAGNVAVMTFDDIKKEVTLDPKAPYDYFMAHKSEFRIQGRTRVSRIFLKYEEKNREEVYKKAKALKDELTKENFAEKAKTMSEDAKAKLGGDYGLTEWQSFTKQEKSLINSLNTEEISPPIDTFKGFSLLLINEKVAARQQNFDEVQQKIIGTMKDQKAKELVQEKLEKIHKALGKDADLKAKAKELNVKIIETELLTPGQKIADIDPMGYISRSLFSMEKEKEIKFPVQFPKGIAIAQLTKIEEPALEQFENAKPRVKAKVLEQKKIEHLKVEAKSLVELMGKAKDEKALNELLKTKDLKLDTLKYKRGNRFSYMKTKEGLDEIIFGLPKGTFSDPIEFETDVVIVKVKNVKISTDEEFGKNKNEFYQQKVQELKRGYFASYLSNKKNEYQFTQNRQLFDEVVDHVLTRFN